MIVVSSALATVVLIIAIVSVTAYYFADFRTGIRLATDGYAAGLAGNTDLAIENFNQALRHALTKYQRSFVFLNGDSTRQFAITVRRCDLIQR